MNKILMAVFAAFILVAGFSNCRTTREWRYTVRTPVGCVSEESGSASNLAECNACVAQARKWNSYYNYCSGGSL